MKRERSIFRVMGLRINFPFFLGSWPLGLLSMHGFFPNTFGFAFFMVPHVCFSFSSPWIISPRFWLACTRIHSLSSRCGLAMCSIGIHPTSLPLLREIALTYSFG